jgi:Rne/Rng family ribonuclease
MSKELVISATPHETRVAIVEDGQLCEIYIEREKEFALVGSLYKGRVTRVLPGMQSAFVDIGLDSDAFLYVSDFLEHLEDYDHVEPKAQRPPQHSPQPPGEVFAPSTTNGGVVAEPGHDLGHEENVDFVPLAASPESVNAPAAEAVTSTAPAAPAQNAPPFQRSQRPFDQRPGRGGPNDRGGRNRRWGRQGGGRDRRPPGRDLPPSKYASPRPFDSRPPRESQPYEPPPPGYEPVILPGESLAKYKDRIPAPPAEHPASASTVQAETPVSTPAESSAPESTAVALPDSLFASSYTDPYTSEPEIPVQQESVIEVIEKVELFQEPVAAAPVEEPPAVPELAYQKSEPEPEPQPEFTEAVEAHSPSAATLSDDEVTSLAEQLAEAKHEEAQAEADDLPEPQETGAEPFVEEAELEDLQDALNDDHEDDAAEADAVADEMHDEAMAAESSPEETHTDTGSGFTPEASDEETKQGEVPFSTEGALDHSELQQPSDAQPTSARISEQPRARFQRPMRRGGRPQRGGGGGGRRGGRPNDQRPRPQPTQHGHPRHEHNRRPQLISEMLKAGEEIIVQIAKEPLGKKGARITSHVALPGRFLVYMPTVDHIGVSRRIGSAEDRSRLRRVVTEAKGTFPGGFIVRTAAGEATDDEIRDDVEFLGRTWDTIRTGSEQRRAPALLHRDLNLVQRILRDYLSDDYVAIWLDNEEEFSKVVEFVGRFQPKLVNRVKLYTKEAPIFEEFGIQQDLDKALRPKVWLKSGGHIVINHTEALVAIDINTGKYVGRGSTRLEDTIVKTNLEAVDEIVRQIRLRDLGGIIVIDFIDMEERRNREKVLAALDQALSQDRAPSKALSFNEFGLVCITRKRTKQALERVLCQPCPYCTGSGMVKSIPTICYEIQAEARKMAVDLDAPSLTLRVNPEIAKTLKTRESAIVEELEQSTRKSIIIQSDPTLHWEQYDIY